MKASLPGALLACWLWMTFTPNPIHSAQIFLGQGTLAGEVTTDSVILQARLTGAESVIDGDVPGMRGVLRFEIDEHPTFPKPIQTAWMNARPDGDFMVKTRVTGLKPDTEYYYRPVFGSHERQSLPDIARVFRTLGGKSSERPVKFVMGSCMNYAVFHSGKDGKGQGAALGVEKDNGYVAFTSMFRIRPDFYIGNGDNVYYDNPLATRAKTVQDMRRKWHEQFVQVTMNQLFAITPTYWLKDDHDYRFNDADSTQEQEPSHGLGIRIFREQLPVVDPADTNAVTYRTHRVSRHLQLWFVEGRDHRSPNKMRDGPEKSIWGKEQKEWLKRTLKESDATFKLLISPTPMIGPDDASKRDNHANIGGFRHEGEEFFEWMKANDIGTNQFFILCGDRHWQYQSQHPSGYQEFACGALNTQNARTGPKPGAEKSTDPRGEVKQMFTSPKPVGGFLLVEQGTFGKLQQLQITFKDESGTSLHSMRILK
ncbi:MAG TPA: alkaline phosphatase D family protein [Verrucomicrobiae bacterium]